MQLPEELEKILKDLPYKENTVGLSGATIIEYDQYILKIQAHQQITASILTTLQGKIPLPQLIYYQDPYLLMSKVEGKMSYELLDDMDTLIPLLAKALKQLWQADTTSLPLVNQLEEKKKRAISNIKDDLFGFKCKKELISYIQDYRDDLLLSHGDLCLPNIILSDKIQYIDVDQMGLNSKWCDITILLRSLQYNLEGRYGGKVYPYYDVDRLFDYLDVKKDEQQIKYHFILDELL